LKYINKTDNNRTPTSSITSIPLSDDEWEIILSIPLSNKPNLPITNEELDELFKEQ